MNRPDPRALFGSITRLRVVRVRGRSMEPTLRDGDLMLALWGAPVRRGDLVVVDLPPDADGVRRPLALKRHGGPDPARPDDPTWIWLERDNPREGVDSWQVGPLPRTSVQARALLRLPRIRLRGVLLRRFRG
ncbi:S24/S26 family peptidase [Janibacter sp. GXQ6167]|uniref:S24/S26 family peptidase n=1 Tax=Janibacter sp. GXQ6167 TaxID=3240791 RepID=UPI0035241A45